METRATAFKADITQREAIALQQELRDKVTLVPLSQPPTYVGGCDVSMDRFATEGYAGFVTLSYPPLELVAHSVVKSTIPFPYIPGLLSFREIPMLLKAWDALTIKPDVLMVDGIGIAHPRRFGIACHLGVLLDLPTIGCAKSLLTGTYTEPASEAGSFSYIYDRKTNEIIGAAVRTKNTVKPMIISPGHKITLQESIDLVLSCVKRYRLPEPTRYAHNTVNEYRVADNAFNAF